jgi:hypothetical protein
VIGFPSDNVSIAPVPLGFCSATQFVVDCDKDRSTYTWTLCGVTQEASEHPSVGFRINFSYRSR